MPGTTSRNTRSARGNPSPSKQAPPPDISDFTRLAKNQQSLGKNSTPKKRAQAEITRTSSIEIVLGSRKRKVNDDFDLECPPTITKKLRQKSDDLKGNENIAPLETPRKKKKTVRFKETGSVKDEHDTESIKLDLKTIPKFSAPAVSASRKRRLLEEDDEPLQKNNCDATEAETLLERLALQSSAKRRSKHHVGESSEHDLPRELVQLLDLQAAFLKTYTMQLAHNGSNSPVDLRTLLPSVTRTWGKRKVTIEDIQRCIGVLNWVSSAKSTATTRASFYLSDYGRGKICIELHESHSGPLQEHKLNMDFESNLRALWHSRRPGQVASLFLSTLPQAPIKSCASAIKAASLLNKNQRILEELKNGVVRKQQLEQEKKQQLITPPAPLKPDGTKLSLLDRIRLKENQAALAALTGPSAAELQRRAALQRAEDVASVIGMLCTATGAQARMAFTMSALLVKLKDSLRTPISQEDAAGCVRLLASEVAPQWLRIVTVGGRENVVVQTALQPSKTDVAQRAKALLG
ncbi:hypothetical protein QBC32DRAFT_344671 [Pseudoneurospora amorphoporcata]|uniref:DNA replication factor Cdt1 C-terminal domain-containing protein n=1 Tax=Pseudoneurospora amorphoporcata TaxID=241081 RepID=A0AAN6SEY6_9PEZI|nr:hypothetical protein QBC32DRAFT_344671 [Pseudoneurospora amorphoporcata]